MRASSPSGDFLRLYAHQPPRLSGVSDRLSDPSRVSPRCHDSYGRPEGAIQAPPSHCDAQTLVHLVRVQESNLALPMGGSDRGTLRAVSRQGDPDQIAGWAYR